MTIVTTKLHHVHVESDTAWKHEVQVQTLANGNILVTVNGGEPQNLSIHEFRILRAAFNELERILSTENKA
jgi:hypothetical protein